VNRINILDCTLRDGGYINDWEFGKNNIYKIIEQLYNSNLNIIECGFLDPLGNNDTTRYNSFETINSIIGAITKKQSSCKFVSMIELEKYNSKNLPILKSNNPNQITGIRLTFRKSAIEKFIKIAKEILDKGYELYIQPISTVSYTDKEILDLIDVANRLKPSALYIVDTHGSIDWHSYNLKRIFTLLDNNLVDDVSIGFHSHNNLQLSYALSCELINISTPRNIIIDSTLLGMGRGAGNLHTEMICNYLNTKKIGKFDELNIIDTIQKYIEPIKNNNAWGYSVPYFLSSSNICHPDYVSFFLENSKTFVEIDKLLKRIAPNEKLEFNRKIAKECINEK
tara:strand:- start:2838 stop:3854 length:1017 start_codon:yes stop_codon:yes gene_type:complete